MEEKQNYMAKRNLQAILELAQEIDNSVQDGDELEDWVEDKLSVVKAYLSDVKYALEKSEPMHDNDTSISPFSVWMMKRSEG